MLGYICFVLERDRANVMTGWANRPCLFTLDVYLHLILPMLLMNRNYVATRI